MSGTTPTGPRRAPTAPGTTPTGPATTPTDPGTAPPPPPNGTRARTAPLTTFRAEVAAVVGALRPGDVATYAEVAAEIGRPGSAQAVANVLRTVPDLPWWRVVPTDGRLYRTHAPTQRPLLEADGVRVDDDRRVHPPPAP